MKAFIVAQQRTGSTLLYEYIDSHPGLFCADELFIMARKPIYDYRFRMIKIYQWYQKNKKWTVDQYLNWIWSLAPKACIKVLYHQVEYYNLHPIVFNAPVIHIYRKNYFKRAVSRFHTVGRMKQTRPEEYIQDIRTSMHKDDLWEKALKSRCPKYMKLAYEDLVGRTEVVRKINYTFCNGETGKKICNFFDAPYFEMFTGTQKAIKKKDYFKLIPEGYRDQVIKRLREEFPEEVWK